MFLLGLILQIAESQRFPKKVTHRIGYEYSYTRGAGTNFIFTRHGLVEKGWESPHRAHANARAHSHGQVHEVVLFMNLYARQSTISGRRGHWHGSGHGCFLRLDPELISVVQPSLVPAFHISCHLKKYERPPVTVCQYAQPKVLARL